MEVQELKSSDISATKELIAEVVLEFYADLDWLPKNKRDLLAHYEKVGYLRDIDQHQDIYSGQNGRFYLLKQSQVVFGCCGVKRLNETDGELVRLWVKSEKRKLGYGKLLYDQVMQAAEQIGFKRLYLDTSSRCADALGLFRRNGFVDCAKYKESIGDIFLTKAL